MKMNPTAWRKCIYIYVYMYRSHLNVQNITTKEEVYVNLFSWKHATDSYLKKKKKNIQISVSISVQMKLIQSGELYQEPKDF